MDEIVEEAYVLSMNELVVMLKGMGYRKCFGLLAEEIELSREEIIKVLAEMTRKKIISSNGYEFTVLQPFKEIVRNMVEADYVIAVHNKIHNEDICYYVSEGRNIIQCERNTNKSDKFRFHTIRNGRSLKWRYLPKSWKIEELSEKLFSEKEDEEKGIYSDFIESMEEKENVISVTEIVQINSDMKSSILIAEDGLSVFMMISDYYGIRREPYSVDRYITLIHEFTGGILQ